MPWGRATCGPVSGGRLTGRNTSDPPPPHGVRMPGAILAIPSVLAAPL